MAVQLTYLDSIADYRMAAVESRRLVGLSRREARADTALVLPFQQAHQIADSWLHDVWSGRESASFTLPPSRMAIEPGDNLLVTIESLPRQMRVTDISDGMARSMEARSIDQQVFEYGQAASRYHEPVVNPSLGKPEMVFLDLPQLDGDGTRTGTRVAAYADPWPGGIAVYRSRTGVNFGFLQVLNAPASLGRTLDNVPAGPTSRWDRRTGFCVKMDNGALASKTTDEVLDGENLAAIGLDGGPWEVIQFADAVLVAEDTYEISMLLRGQSGSEEAMASDLPAGARFVMLDGSIDFLEVGLDDIGVPVVTRSGPSRFDPGHATFDERIVTASDTGLRPLSPVHVKAVLENGDLNISFIRRSRVDGDNWVPVEIPLGQASERYEIDIYDGAALVRTLSSGQPAATYFQADQIADGVSLPGSLDLEIFQMSEIVGRGYAGRASVSV